MIRVIQHNCGRSYEWTIAALETGVKHRTEVVCLPQPPTERGRIGISHLADEIRKRKRVWRAMRRGSSLVVDKRMDLSRGANEDVIVTDVRCRGERITRIVNVYDQKKTHSEKRPAQKFNW